MAKGKFVVRFIFASANTISKDIFNTIEGLVEVCGEIFDVSLNGETEFSVLLSLIGIDCHVVEDLPDSIYFSGLIDISGHSYSKLTEADFDRLFDDWISKSGRESSMDEYGQLVFLQGHAHEWNTMRHRFILVERP